MSLDIGIGLAHLTGRTLIPYNANPPWFSNPILRPNIDYSCRATVVDLFDIPIDFENTHAANTEIDPGLAKRLLRAPVYESVFNADLTTPIDHDDFQAFRNGREFVFSVAQDLHEDTDLIVDLPTLGMYSYFFYLNKSQRSDLHRIYSQLRPRAPYRDLAVRIASSLAPFNAVHIRRGDFAYSGLTQRADRVCAQEITNNLAERLSRDVRLVICTDGSAEDSWFAPLLHYFHEVIFLDRLLINSTTWRDELSALPYHDDAVLGMITQLVATKAEIFVGTLYSSFSAMIQRARGLERGRPEFLYCYSDWDAGRVPYQRCEFPPVQDGPYSWNRILYPVAASAISWLRDWPESHPDAAAEITPRILPRGSILLRASEARVHGVSVRYERSHVHDNVGYWTNSKDFVSWDFKIIARMRCRIEIRYACPDDCAGSVYQIEIQDKPLFRNTIQGTGGWTLFSNWQELGTLDVPSGRYKLAVKILNLSGFAAMNLAGLRLVPTNA